MTKEKFNMAEKAHERLEKATEILQAIKSSIEDGRFSILIQTKPSYLNDWNKVSLPDEISEAIGPAILGLLVLHVEKLQKQFEEI